jgi:hypothetical protein
MRKFRDSHPERKINGVFEDSKIFGKKRNAQT